MALVNGFNGLAFVGWLVVVNISFVDVLFICNQ
jgi:hypothetical protein